MSWHSFQLLPIAAWSTTCNLVRPGATCRAVTYQHGLPHFTSQAQVPTHTDGLSYILWCHICDQLVEGTERPGRAPVATSTGAVNIS